MHAVALLIATVAVTGQTAEDAQRLEAEGRQKFDQLLAGSVGMSVIDGQSYYLFTFAPEFSLGKFGVGLDVDLRLSTKGFQLYKEDWNSFDDVLNIIRYIRYGEREGETRAYLRIGALDAAKLGYGQIVFNYRNSLGRDSRQRGMELELNDGVLGIEALYSNFARPEVAGMRASLRPLRRTEIPLLGRLELGGSVVADLARRAGYTTPAGTPFTLWQTDDGPDRLLTPGAINAGTPALVGVDAGVPVFQDTTIDVRMYVDAAMLVIVPPNWDPGIGSPNVSGRGLGAGASISLVLPSASKLDVRLEHRLIGAGYRPSYFDAFYESDRIRTLDSVTVDSDTIRNLTTRFSETQVRQSTESGASIDSRFAIENQMVVSASYQFIYREPFGGQLHLGIQYHINFLNLVLNASFDARGDEYGHDVLQHPGRTLARVDALYHLNRYVGFAVAAESSYAPETVVDGRTLGYKRQTRVEPRVVVEYGF